MEQKYGLGQNLWSILTHETKGSNQFCKWRQLNCYFHDMLFFFKTEILLFDFFRIFTISVHAYMYLYICCRFPNLWSSWSWNTGNIWIQEAKFADLGCWPVVSLPFKFVITVHWLLSSTQIKFLYYGIIMIFFFFFFLQFLLYLP